MLGILNGTTNYILTRMAQQYADFETALEEAQNLGYAEADPTNDLEGIDAAYKLAVLSTLAFRARVKDTDVHREGIPRLTARDLCCNLGGGRDDLHGLVANKCLRELDIDFKFEGVAENIRENRIYSFAAQFFNAQKMMS